MATNPNILRADDVLDLPVPEGVIGYAIGFFYLARWSYTVTRAEGSAQSRSTS